MTLQTTGPISLLNVQGEFGGSGSIAISEYYSAASGVPSTGIISFNDFYGASDVILSIVTVTEGKIEVYGDKFLPAAYYGYHNDKNGRIAFGSRSPTTINGFTIISMDLTVFGTSRSAGAKSFFIEVNGDAPKELIYSIAIQDGPNLLGANATHNHNEAYSSWHWSLPADVARWDGTGTSTCHIYYQP